MTGTCRSRGFRAILALSLLTAAIPCPAAGQARETAGVITEIKVGRGRVEMKAAGAPDWRPAGPLLALRAGDTVRATENASAVVLLSGGRGSVRVDAATSPFVVAATGSAESKIEKARALIESSLAFLSTGPKEAPTAVLGTRGLARPPVVVTPRNGPVLPDTLSFEWIGSRFAGYTVRLVGPGGTVLEREGLTGGRFDYPPDAPRLTPGVRYTVQIRSAYHPPQEAWFELLDATRARAIRQDLVVLEQALGPGTPPNSLAALRAAVLAREGLRHDARLVLIAALTKDPDEPTLHQLLGNLYAAAGLPELAAEAHDEAQFLLTRGAR